MRQTLLKYLPLLKAKGRFCPLPLLDAAKTQKLAGGPQKRAYKATISIYRFVFVIKIVQAIIKRNVFTNSKTISETSSTLEYRLILL